MVLLNSLIFSDYLLVAALNDDVAKLIQAERQQYAKIIEDTHLSSATAYIKLVNFTQALSMEERIRSRLRLIALQQKAFQIELLNFGCYPTHTLYINTITKTQLRQLSKKLKQDMQSMLKLDIDNKPFFQTELNIILAQKIKPWQFEKVWSHYQHAYFSAKSMCHHLLLFKKQNAANGFTLVEKFEFQNLPIYASQVNLFE